MVANPARRQPNREKKKILSPYLYAPENLVSRDGFSRPQSFSTLRLDLGIV